MIEELQRAEFFHGFDEQALADIASFAERRTWEKGATIFERDAEARHVYLVVRGRVRQGFEVGPGREVWFQTIEPGGLFGLPALIPPRAHNIKAVASERTELIAIDADRLLAYLEEHPRFGFLFMERIAKLYQRRLNNCRLQVVHLLPVADSGPVLD